VPFLAADWKAMATVLGESQGAWYQRIMPMVDSLIIFLLLLIANLPQPQQLPKLTSISPVVSDASALAASIKSDPEIYLPASSSTSFHAIMPIVEKPTASGSAEIDAVHSDSKSSLSPTAPVYGKMRGEDILTHQVDDNPPPKKSFNLNRLSLLPFTIHADAPAFSLAEETELLAKPLFIRIGLSSSVFTSAAEFNDEGILGGLIGLRFELPINSRLSIISGVQYGKKGFDRLMLNVEQSNNILTREPTYWVSRLKGEIQMMEIPLHLRYRFSPAKRVSLYFQAGLSAAVTLDERYWNYDPRAVSNIAEMQTRTDIDFTRAQNNPVLEAYLENIDPKISRHTLNTYIGFLQVAPGIEIEVGSNLFLQAEPYIQFGVQRIGSERQRLHSLGGTLSLSYQLGNQ